MCGGDDRALGPASGKGPAWAGWGCKSKSGPKDSWPVMGRGTVEGPGVEEPSSSMFSASSMLSSCARCACIQVQFMETTSRGGQAKPPNGFWKERGGGEGKCGDGWEGIGNARGWGGWIGSWKAGYNSHWFLAVIMGDLLCLDRAQVNTYGNVMIQHDAAAHDSPHTRAKAATPMIIGGHVC